MTKTSQKSARVVTKADAAKAAKVLGQPADPSAPITGLRTAKPADKRGPKPGSARTNQLEQAAKAAAPKADADSISSVKGVASGKPGTVVKAGDQTIVIPQERLTAALNKLAVVGGSMAAVVAYMNANKLTPQLANGVTGRDAPHAAKAAADARRNVKPISNRPQAPAKAAEPKGAKNKAPSSGADFTYKVTGNAADRKPGTWTRHMLDVIIAHTSTAAAKAAHVKSGQYSDKKLHFSWARDKGYISY